MIRLRTLASAFTMISVISCSYRERPDAQLSRVLDAWLHCEECVAGERDAVRLHRDAIVPELRAALLAGPSSAQRAHMRHEYETAHRSLGASASSNRDEYVNMLLANYVAVYQKRSATSLADIGGTAATNALREALEPGQFSQYRNDVQVAIRVAHASLTNRWFEGTMTPTAPAFGDTVTLTPSAGTTFAADYVAQLEGALFPDSTARVSASLTSLRFVVTAPVGQRMLTIRREAGADTMLASLVVRSTADANDRSLAQCADDACRRASAPQLLNNPGVAAVFLSLWRSSSGSDTVDLFRFDPVQNLHIAAEADWSPDGVVALRWTSCVTLGIIIDSTWTSGPRSRGSMVALASDECGLLSVVLSSPGQAVTAVHLRLRALPVIP